MRGFANSFVPLLLALSLSLASATKSPFGQALKAKRQECGDNVIETCDDGSAEDCVNAICGNCSGDPSIAACCSMATDDEKAQCIVNVLENETTASASLPATIPSATFQLTTASPTPTASASLSDPNYQACQRFNAVNDQCAAETPGFSDISAFSSQASCLCYVSSTYAPASYDGDFASCLSWFKTSDPEDYTSITAAADGSLTLQPCSAAGDVRTSPAAASASATRAGGTNPSETGITSFNFGGATAVTTSSSPSRATATPAATVTVTPDSATSRVSHFQPGLTDASDIGLQQVPPLYMATIVLAAIAMML